MMIDAVRRRGLATGLFLLVGLVAPSTAASQPILGDHTAAVSDTASPRPRRPFFVEVEGGASYLALVSVQGSATVFPNVATFTGWGPGFGLTAGVHDLRFSLALQVHASFFGGDGVALAPSPGNTAAVTFQTVGTTLEGAFRLPLGRVELALRVGAGHLYLTGFAGGATTSSPRVTAHGWAAHGGLGVDVPIYRGWFVGLDADFAVAAVHRAAVEYPDCASDDPHCMELREDGDAIAFMFHPHLQLGLRF